MKNIEKILLNTKKYLLKETQNAMLIKAPKIPWFNEKIGIWFPKRFVYKGKYENSICIGIIKDSKYQVISINQKEKETKLIKGQKILTGFFIAEKENNKKDTNYNYFKGV
ncbi:hypothetical protein [Spiroplasma endosymbiont of 'Nebria riversi']|uniref:hypothetical protein n=1 Tax=Spiroplasma endosymbiont of 'Nebria riversi' TaxID=2792084 RepID=UPI001C044CA7|nr:hypothetical protein [Spiroplasma endosymbiont of 'Nebria riversi']